MSADCSTSKRTSFSSFQQPLNSCTNTSDVEQFRINEVFFNFLKLFFYNF